jgi:flagellar basal body-associated protein FliL
MSEEQNESTGKSIKNIIIGLVSTITLGVGTWVTTKLTGGDKEEAAPVQQAAPVINIQNNQTQTAGGGKTVVVKEKETVKEVPAKPKKDGDEFKEKPAQW